MINFDDVTKENINEHNSNCPQISDHLYIILITGGPESAKTNPLFNLIKKQDQDDNIIIDKIYLHAKDPCKGKYQYPIKKSKNLDLIKLSDPKAFTEYSNDIEVIYKNVEKYNLNRQGSVLLVYDDMLSNKKLN